MQILFSSRILFAIASLAAMLPLSTPTDPVAITGHHDDNSQGDGNGFDITSGSYLILSPQNDNVTHHRSFETTFNNNNAAGLTVMPNASAIVRNGQFNGNKIGLSLDRASATVAGGQFSSNIEDGLFADGGQSGPASGSTLTVSGGQFRDNKDVGLDVLLCPAVVSEGQFIGNGTGLEADGATITIRGGEFIGNTKYGLAARSDAIVSITGGTFTGNTVTDLYSDGGTITLTGTFRQKGAAMSGTLTGSGMFDVLFPGSQAWQTLTYQAKNDGKIVLQLATAPDLPATLLPSSP